MKKLSIFVGTLIFIGAIQASALEVGVTTDVKVKSQGNATSSLKAETDNKIGVTESKNNTNSSSIVSTSAREIRGWSESDKKEFLTTVKTQAQLKSGQDLDNFARGVMLKDENVVAVDAGDSNVEVRYKLPAKFLGFFGSEISAITNVTFETDKQGRGPKEVSVKFPWYRRFFSIASSTRADLLEIAIDKSVQVYAQIPRDNTYAQNGTTIQLISNILKGIRAEIEVNANTNIE